MANVETKHSNYVSKIEGLGLPLIILSECQSTILLESEGAIKLLHITKRNRSSGSKEPRSALESRRVSLGAHWVD